MTVNRQQVYTLLGPGIEPRTKFYETDLVPALYAGKSDIVTRSSLSRATSIDDDNDEDDD
jgi:hypothetical protein